MTYKTYSMRHFIGDLCWLLDDSREEAKNFLFVRKNPEDAKSARLLTEYYGKNSLKIDDDILNNIRYYYSEFDNRHIRQLFDSVNTTELNGLIEKRVSDLSLVLNDIV